ncbi:Conserved hypothetical protein [Vibrio nigripulchritudo SFn27]|uniref:GmrSD restriction endonucleases N-terminal domain-containing protein n=1 Tax=Vibrio nigripulchritudo TaxID=28173 RepID=U4K8V1_9VIBR|nr:DUF262 domain-containing protein [Vibrio nigripulchritudo]CCN83290.1 Conserved hypothetical protein [Vibrio nigripulchritudo BLFn1]CCN86800.1 Conserved hypothetical protein [Vibrio nigripulchritudo SFn27]CCN95383.1 Conserved hypothetical protein [Vibrio nigripulchritudo ENn2]CCO41540.1 Conserved hypothetical protein [Vibrio nigripulchritudo SFn135]CCO53515.1 Conserved hypothetical protein [Vibrio nigripulchritudo Wn13]
MSFQTPITIAEAIRNIEENRYLLPSIQREFEWKHQKIEWLFDSIMRDYPISSFLFWRVEGDTKQDFKFYRFIRDFRIRYKTHNEEFNTHGHNDFTAILDGQQRLTSLYIGLRGSYAYRTPRLREENTERVYPTRCLYLNLSHPLQDEEDGRIYQFKFLTQLESQRSDVRWFKVSDIYALSDDFEFNKYLDEHDYKSNEFSYRTLSTLKNVIHSKAIINFFLEKEQTIDKALNIFIRINSGGEPLNFSDLLMSIAVANWEGKNARSEIHGLTDNIRDKGFNISKDFILKSFLYLHSRDIKFKVTNFSRTNAKDFEKEWDKIRNTILSAFDLIKSFGFTDATLTSKNALLPVIYYLYHRGISKDFHKKTEHASDRTAIKKWLHIMLVKRIFGGSSDGVLNQVRRAFTDNITEKKIFDEITSFPADVINTKIRRDTAINDEYIDDLLLTQKNGKYAFSILALLYPNLDYRNNDFHKDHLHPEHSYRELSEAFREDLGWNIYDSIINLQMLDANENMSKNGAALKDWVNKETKSVDRTVFLQSHLIPDIDLELSNFAEFVNVRRALLADKLKKLLS